MKVYSFCGGVHPSGQKDIAKNIPVREMPVPDELVVPLIQHAGAPCEPLVKKGDKVLAGQKIGDNAGFVTAPVHASSSGEVIDVKKHPHPLGQKILSVIIKTDKKDEWIETRSAGQPDSLTPDEIKKIIRESGLVGLGGAAFPTHVKLSPPKDAAIDTLIINGVECEPFLTADYRLMLENSEDIKTGIKIFLKALGINKAYLAIEDNKPEAVKAMSGILEDESEINVVVVKTKYPQGSEKQLIEAITRRKVSMGKLPFHVGVVVQNVGTAKAVADAVLKGKPLTDRVLTVTGSNIKNPSNLKVKIGAKFSDVISFCGGPVEKLAKVIMGGPMMGIAVSTTDVPVIKGASGILLFNESEIEYRKPGPCINCGKCLEVCPMGLAPGRFVESAEIKDYEKTLEDNILNCMECGSCSYVCPARRPMIQWIKLAKLEIQKKKNQEK